MSIKRLLLTALIVYAPLAPGADKDIQNLQRDVALLQMDMQNFKRSQEDKLTALTALVQQTLDAANKANTAAAVLDNSIRQHLKEQEKSVIAPVAGVGAKVDQMTGDFQGLRDSVADVSARLGKLQQQIVDLSNAVKVMQAPATPPPAASGAPPMPAETLYQNALRDRSGGKSELALQQFNDYLKYYGDTDLAPNAQYYIGEIHFSQGDLDFALKEFDLVLEKYPDNSKTPDALYMKGLTLVKMGKRTLGSQEFQELAKRFPANNLATKACSQLKEMGLRCPAASAASRRSSKK
jgi:tol-pal system protein YbgF